MSRIIQVKSVEQAVSLFYSKTEIVTSDIKELFGIKGDTVVRRLKKVAKEVMEEDGVQCWNPNAIDTECAYKAWHLDIKKLERMLKKQRDLGLNQT